MLQISLAGQVLADVVSFIAWHLRCSCFSGFLLGNMVPPCLLRGINGLSAVGSCSSPTMQKPCWKLQEGEGTFSKNRCLFWCFSDWHLFISSASRNWLLDTIFQLPDTADFTFIFHDRTKHLHPILCIGVSSYWLWWIAGLHYVLCSYPQQSHPQWRHTQRGHPSPW